MRQANEITEDIESLPFGDIEGDHVLLDKYTVETLKLCLDKFEWADEILATSDIQFLLLSLIQKWELLQKEFWYA